MATATFLIRRQPLYFTSSYFPRRPRRSLPSPQFTLLPPTCCAAAVSSSSSISPFTEKDSITRYQRDGWVYHANGNGNGDSDSNGNVICLFSSQLSSETEPDRDREIELQLPELRKLLELIRSDKRKIDKVASVALVGTGPGDPELLTVKAVRAIEKADLVLYDRLVSNEVLDLVGPSARLLYVGKTAGFHSRTQVSLILYIWCTLFKKIVFVLILGFFFTYRKRYMSFF